MVEVIMVTKWSLSRDGSDRVWVQVMCLDDGVEAPCAMNAIMLNDTVMHRLEDDAFDKAGIPWHENTAMVNSDIMVMN